MNFIRCARSPLCSALLALLILVTADARAQSKAATAEALFEEGRDAMEAQDYDTACARFRESNRLDPGAGTVLNLARCEEERGKLATAWQLYKNALGQLDAGDERVDIAKERAADLAAASKQPALAVGASITPSPQPAPSSPPASSAPACSSASCATPAATARATGARCASRTTDATAP